MDRDFWVLIASMRELTELAEELTPPTTPEKLRQLENVIIDCQRVARRLQGRGGTNGRVKNPR